MAAAPQPDGADPPSLAMAPPLRVHAKRMFASARQLCGGGRRGARRWSTTSSPAARRRRRPSRRGTGPPTIGRWGRRGGREAAQQQQRVRADLLLARLQPRESVARRSRRGWRRASPRRRRRGRTGWRRAAARREQRRRRAPRVLLRRRRRVDAVELGAHRLGTAGRRGVTRGVAEHAADALTSSPRSRRRRGRGTTTTSAATRAQGR